MCVYIYIYIYISSAVMTAFLVGDCSSTLDCILAHFNLHAFVKMSWWLLVITMHSYRSHIGSQKSQGGPSAAHFSMYFLASAAPSRLMSSLIDTMSPFVVSTCFISSSRSRDSTTCSSCACAHRRRKSAFAFCPTSALYSLFWPPPASRWKRGPRDPRGSTPSMIACRRAASSFVISSSVSFCCFARSSVAFCCSASMVFMMSMISRSSASAWSTPPPQGPCCVVGVAMACGGRADSPKIARNENSS